MSLDRTPAWARGPLRIARQALRDIEAEAVAAYARQEEACGYVTGPLDDPSLADQSHPLQNLANAYHQADPEGHPRTGREYFKINVLKFEQAIQAAADSRRAVKIFFHSHLDCGAYFSDEDAASMTMGSEQEPTYCMCYLVTAVDQGEVTAHALFAWTPETRSFEPVGLQIL